MSNGQPGVIRRFFLAIWNALNFTRRLVFNLVFLFLVVVIVGAFFGTRPVLLPRTALVLAIVWCFAIVGFATSTVYVVALPLLFVAGFLELSFNAMAMTLVQLHAPASMRGRVIGLYNMAALGMRAFSGVTIGVIGGLIGIHWSLALSAVVLLAIILTLFAFSTRAA